MKLTRGGKRKKKWEEYIISFNDQTSFYELYFVKSAFVQFDHQEAQCSYPVNSQCMTRGVIQNYHIRHRIQWCHVELLHSLRVRKSFFIYLYITKVKEKVRQINTWVDDKQNPLMSVNSTRFISDIVLIVSLFFCLFLLLLLFLFHINGTKDRLTEWRALFSQKMFSTSAPTCIPSVRLLVCCFLFIFYFFCCFLFFVCCPLS